MAGEAIELGKNEVEAEPAPGLAAPLHRAHDRIDADELHGPQNERRNRGRQIHALRQAAGGNRAAILHLGEHVGQSRGADRVHRAGPASLGKHLWSRVELIAVDDRGGAETFEKLRFDGSPRRGGHGEAELRQEGHRHRADAAGSAGHQHLAVSRRHTLVLERHDAQHGGVSGGADGHGAGGVEAAWNLDQPVAAHPGAFGKPAMMGLADAPAIEDDLVARREARMAGVAHRAGKVDARDQRERADDRRLAGEGQPILVIDGGIFDVDGDITLHQVGLGQIGKLDRLAGIASHDAYGAETFRHRYYPLRTRSWPKQATSYSVRASASRNRSGSPSGEPRMLPSHMTRRPRKMVPTGQPCTSKPS